VQLAVAIWVDGVRLIDNVRIDPADVAPKRIVPADESAHPQARVSEPAPALLAARR
jgi:hypothetical protein